MFLRKLSKRIMWALVPIRNRVIHVSVDMRMQSQTISAEMGILEPTDEETELETDSIGSEQDRVTFKIFNM